MWILLAAALGGFLIPRLNRLIPATVLCLALILAFHGQVLSGSGVLNIVLIGLLVAARYRYRGNEAWVIGNEVILLLCCLGLFLHLLPGFHNPRVVDNIAAGPLSARFDLYFNLDKALVPVILLACIPTLFNGAIHTPRRWYVWCMLALSIPALLGLAVWLGGLRVEPHFPSWLGQFMLSNLFFVALAEEALFRGYLMQRLQKYTHHNGLALMTSAAIFGLAHIAGGWLLVIFAALAGVIYGLAWLWSGKLWVATLFHFMLNLIHLMFFTYPFYRPGG